MFVKSSNEYHSVKDEITRINRKRMYYAGTGTMVVNLATVIYCLFFVSIETNAEMKWHIGLIANHLVLFFIMMTIIICTMYIQKKKTSSKLICFFQYAMIGALILSGSVVTALDQWTHSNIMAFLIVCLIIGTLFVIRPLFAVLNYLIGYGVFCYLIGLIQSDESILIANRINGVAIIVLATCLSYAFWRTNVLTIQQRRIIHQQKEDLKIKNRKLHMAFLQSQIKPHFLYNALNTIIYFCYTDGEKAANLITSLSHYLQNGFDFEDNEESVSISREIELTKAYLDIEQARFGNRLEVIWEVDESLYDERTLPLTIQPLVENAIHHGLMSRRTGGWVKISVQKTESNVLISVEDNGVGMILHNMKQPLDQFEEMKDDESETNRVRTGVGLDNIRKRLNQYYGVELKVDSQLGIGTKISFVLKGSFCHD